MCDKSSVLVIFLILKILILVVLPITTFVLYYFKKKMFNVLGIINVLFIIAFILLRIFGNSCIKNSNYSFIKNYEKSFISENINTLYESVYSTDQYINSQFKNAYLYDINSEPLKDVKLSCDNNSYINNYGNSISAITSIISNAYQIEINEVELINYLEENNLIDCENGIDFDNIINKISEKYYFNITNITKNDISSYISDGKSVLVETKNKFDKDNNFGCEKDYIIIYNINNDDRYNIINPNDKDYSYFCPSNTIGYGSIIEANQNTKSYDLNEIDDKALRYFAIEVK